MNDAPSDTYKKRYVAFLDILGFAALVQEADRNPDRRKAIVKALTTVNRVPRPTVNSSNLRAQIFSDSLIISTYPTVDGLWHLLNSIEALIWNLLQQGILMRGGISLGGTEHNEEIVFGAGVIEAYRLEATVAKHPRVVLSSAVVNEIGRYKNQHEAFNKFYSPRLIRDLDGVTFLHYLKDVAEINHQPPKVLSAEEIRILEDGRRIFSFIQNALDNTLDDPGVYDKYRWLATYWNRAVGVPIATYTTNGIALQLGYLKLAGESSW